MSYSDYVEQIMQNIYRLEGSVCGNGNIGTFNETRLAEAVKALTDIRMRSIQARGEEP